MQILHPPPGDIAYQIWAIDMNDDHFQPGTITMVCIHALTGCSCSCTPELDGNPAAAFRSLSKEYIYITSAAFRSLSKEYIYITSAAFRSLSKEYIYITSAAFRSLSKEYIYITSAAFRSLSKEYIYITTIYVQILPILMSSKLKSIRVHLAGRKFIKRPISIFQASAGAVLPILLM